MIKQRLSLTIIGLFLVLASFADVKNLKSDVTMASYEQAWSDDEGTLALRNNTRHTITRIVFQITYFDMSDQPLDYEVFTKEVEIAPGMTKKLDIPAYEEERDYHYYKSENSISGSTAFKIKFTLKDYDVDTLLTEDVVDETAVELEEDYEEAEDTHGGDRYFGAFSTATLCIFALLFLVLISIPAGLYVLVVIMAKKRKRNVLLCVLMSIVATPLIVLLVLLLIGDEKENTSGGHYTK